MRYDEDIFLRTEPGTMEYLWDKWWKKLWLSFAQHSKKGLMEPPSFLRKEFYRDVNVVVENRLKEIAPEKCVVGGIRLKQDV